MAWFDRKIEWQVVVNGNVYDDDFTRIEWSGGIKGSARVLEVDHLSDITVKTGDKVELRQYGKAIFKGKVFIVNREATSDTFSFIAYDNAVYLNRNKFVKNIYNQQPSQITKLICGEIGLGVGKLPTDKVKCSYPAINRSGYEIILQAYTVQHNKDKEIYSVVCNGEKIEVVKQGTLIGVDLQTEDLREANYTKSIENMINQIIVYETKGDNLQIQNKVSNEEDKSKYGVFQEVMQFDSEQNNLYNAREMLNGLENKAEIQVDGDTKLISGYSITVTESITGIKGTFLIEKDRHIIENNDYYTHLVLSFDNKMDKVEFDNIKKPKKEKKVVGKIEDLIEKEVK